MTTKNAYLQNPYATGPYGSRLYIPYEGVDRATATLLAPHCMWGGATQDTGKAKSWELHPGTVATVMFMLLHAGYTISLLSEENQDQIF